MDTKVGTCVKVFRSFDSGIDKFSRDDEIVIGVVLETSVWKEPRLSDKLLVKVLVPRAKKFVQLYRLDGSC
jgi:hypothetical protein